MSNPILPEELMVEVFSRVPVRDLIRFKCVSKWCCSLVVDPKFIKLHYQRSSKNAHILLTFNNNGYENQYCAPCSVH
uniref:F-box protein At3g49450 family n=1 Tax=Cajanus cajan TaxID=3821 RepID=A0A151S7L7_CAJCA|nr:F-box protein At3g49450 family [Cajanus cajan]